ncbi:MAG: nuclear transport factor 2 family protein [Proteobacteria bacterium]|nr:nuclear transport factor 2 family protein [Pseudomonadota bacterium]MDA1354747.1 nuclear transport factor 2 family protein [Pseudomonadota bacterium]
MAVVDNKRILRKWLSALQVGDLETLTALQSKDCVWILPGSKKLPWAGRWKGAARQRIYLKRIAQAVDFGKQEFKEYIGEGARIVVTGQEIASSKPKGKRWNVTLAWAFTIKRGKITAWEAFENTEIIAACY